MYPEKVGSEANSDLPSQSSVVPEPPPSADGVLLNVVEPMECPSRYNVAVPPDETTAIWCHVLIVTFVPVIISSSVPLTSKENTGELFPEKRASVIKSLVLFPKLTILSDCKKLKLLVGYIHASMVKSAVSEDAKFGGNVAN